MSDPIESDSDFRKGALSASSGAQTPHPPSPAPHADPDPHAAWPPERFFWAVVESSGPSASAPAPLTWKRDGPLPIGLLADVAEQVPVPIEDLHAVGAASDDGRLIVCAARRCDLMALASDPAVRSLSPGSIPECADGPAVIEPRRLNLLVGAFEPMPARRARARRQLASAAAILALSALVTLGLARRAAADRRAADLAQQASRLLLTEMGFSAGDGAARLNEELDERRRVAAADPASRRVPDAAAALNTVLGFYPAGSATAELQSIGLGPEGAVLSVLLEAPGNPASFLSGLRPTDGWSLGEPRLAAVGPHRTRMTLRLRPPATAGRANADGAGPVPARKGGGP